MNIIAYVSALLSLAVLDSVWLFSTGAIYKKWIGHLFAPTVNFIPAILFYLLYALGIVYFIVLPAIKNGTSILNVFLVGALFGVIAYSVYDLTNNATLKDWPLAMTFVDMAWGAVITGLASIVSFSIYKYFK